MFAVMTKEENYTFYATQMFHKVIKNSVDVIGDNHIDDIKDSITKRNISKQTLTTLFDLLVENEYYHAAKQIRFLIDNFRWS